MKAIPLTIALVFSTASVHADRPTYVGGGRYSCWDKTPEYALIQQNNEAMTRRELEHFEDERRRQAERLEDIRLESERTRRSSERRNDEYRTRW